MKIKKHKTESLLKCHIILLLTFIFTFFSIKIIAFELPDEKIEELRIKYKAKIVDGILKIKDRKMLYNAGEELLTREFENDDIRIEAIYQPPKQIDNWMNYQLAMGNLNEFTFFDKLYGTDGIFTRYYNKKDYLYFAFKITSNSGEKINPDKFIKKLKLFDGLGNKVKGEKPKLFKFDKDKNQRVYEEETWSTLPTFENKEFIWVAFPAEKLKEEAGVYYIETKKFMGAKNIQFLWSLPVKLPQCRC